MELTPQTIITAGSVLAAVVLLVKHFAKGVRWVDKQDQQSVDLEALKQKHEADMDALKAVLARDMHDINTEQTLLTYGVLACLKGLKEQGCNGPVTEAINKIEKYLNQKAHED
ncbi:MAG: branched-chain amino acid ABC transporter permease [Oscillibacter sp.]|nr:branched-chain amino acid ABC transporter permease [Oscillibacter sp.]